jgi:hypothetical protein
MKVKLVYKSFNTADGTYYEGDIIDSPEAKNWLDLFPTWFEKVEDKVEDKVKEIVVEELVEEVPSTKKIPKTKKE